MESGYDINEVVREARSRWLKPAEILFILQNHDFNQITQKTPDLPTSGSLFLYNKRVLRNFRRDGHSWRKKKDGRSVGEAHERLKVGNVETLNCYYAHGERNPNFQRRSYWMLDPAHEHIVLVHYRDITEGRHSPGSSTLLSPGPSSTLIRSPISSSPNDWRSESGFEPCHNISSPGSAEVSSGSVIPTDAVFSFHRREEAAESSSASELEVNQVLRKIEEQLSLDNDSVKLAESLEMIEESLNNDYFQKIEPFCSQELTDFGPQVYGSEIPKQEDFSCLYGRPGHLARDIEYSGINAEQYQGMYAHSGAVNINESLSWEEQDAPQSISSSRPAEEQECALLTIDGNSAIKSFAMLAHEAENLEFPAFASVTSTRQTDLGYDIMYFDQSQIGMQPETDSSLTIASKQKFTIQEISPEWGYSSEATKEIVNVLQGYSPPNSFIKKLSRKGKLHVRQEITSKPHSNEQVTNDNDQNNSFPPSPRSQDTNAPLRYPMVNPTLRTGLYPRQDSPEKIVTIEVSYGEENVSFNVSISSGLIELKEEIAKRFKLYRSTFNVKYLENKEKWILIASDADLQEYWEDTLKSPGRGDLRLFVDDVIIDLASSTEQILEMKTQQVVDSHDPEEQIPDETKTFCNTSIRLIKVVFKIVPLCWQAKSSVKEKIKSQCSRKSSVPKQQRTDGFLEVTPIITTAIAKIESPSILLERGLDPEQSKDKESNVENSAVSIIDPFFPVSKSASTSEAVELLRSMRWQRSGPLDSEMASSILRSSSDVIPSLRIKSAEQIEMAPTGTADVPSQKIEIGFTSLKSNKISGSRDVLTQVEEVHHTDPKDQKRSVDYTLLPSVPSFSSFPFEREKVNEENQTGRGQKSVERRTNLERRIQNAIQMITDETTRMVRIYGNGGVGKTTMLKALITNPTTARNFDLIVFVSVSRDWNVRRLQNDIARHLQFSIGEMETENQIAEKLFPALKGLKFLLVLDDAWDMIDFDAVGIPDPRKEMGCKIIIASRSRDVCRYMLADKEVEMDGISKEEAWELFHKQLGGIVDFPESQILAEAIAEECGGSPLTVIVTARALRTEHDVQVWRHALEELIIPRKLGLHYTEGVLAKLKFSYDRLKVHEKNLFLYCALFPEDEEVNICQLIDYCLEEGLLVGNSGDLHKLGHAIVERLIDAALFEILDNGVSLKMHNTIRDLASWILSPNVEGCQFLLGTDLRVMQPTDEGSSSSSYPLMANTFLFPGNSEILLRAASRHKKPLTEEEWRKAKMIYLRDNEVSTLPNSPISLNLVALFLQRNRLIRVIPASFFDRMPSLQILNLSKTRIKSLPWSFFNLSSLRALILRDCERFFVLPAEIGRLKNLEILDLQGTNIMNLPSEICELSRLKNFQVSFYGSNYQRETVKLPAELIPRYIISRLLALEKLGVVLFPGDQRWSKNILSLILEVADLAWLTSLTFSFPEVDLLKVFLQSSVAWQSKRLKMFNFVIGHDAERIVNRVSTDGEFAYATQGQSLRFVNGEGVVPDTILEVLRRATAFYIDHHLDMRRLSEIGTDKINKLKVCIIRECPKIQTIIESQEVTEAVLPFLERLNIHYLWNLRRIWEGSMPTGSFGQLRILSLHACPKLDFVFSASMLSYFSTLEELIVEDCPCLKEIITEDEVTNSSDKLVNLKQITLHYLPEMVSIWKGSWPLLERMSFYYCCSLKNIGLDFELKHTLKEIKAEKDWWDELHWDDTALFLHLQEACFVPISNEDIEGNTYCRCSSSAYHKHRD